MSRFLHGGGIPFIAKQSVDQIAGEPQESGVSFDRAFVPFNHGEPDPTAAITLQYDSGERQRKKVPAKVVTGENTLRVLNTGREDAGLMLRHFDGGAAARLYFRFPIAKGQIKQPSEASLRDLAQAMKSARPAPPASDIPAAYTYFGQFIAHDLSEMKPSVDPCATQNYRSHALDLDSLFDRLPPEAVPSGAAMLLHGLYLGQTRAGGNPTGKFADLGRATGGFPCTADPRNDNNLGVAQVTVALIRFHRRICHLTPRLMPVEQQVETMRHFQSVVLDDYLRRIIDPVVYYDVREHGRKVLFPNGAVSDFRVPIEFAAACFRFGHLMVRDQYDWNARLSPDPTADLIRQTSHLGNLRGPNDALPDDWVVDWDRFLAAGTNPDPNQFAFCIRSHLNGDLAELDRGWIDLAILPRLSPPLPNLAELTLLRGRDLALPSGEALTAVLNLKLGGTLSIAPVGNTLQTVSGGADGISPASIAELTGNTPLWFYILREAEELGNGGRRLGPLGSRIVMETIHCAIEAAEGNILTGDHFHVLDGISSADRNKLTLPELVAASMAA